MDLSTEKKWFVYLGDHHEGPFSGNEIQGKLSQGQISTSSYAWTEGMADWKLLPEIPDLQSFLSISTSPNGSGNTSGQPENPAELNIIPVEIHEVSHTGGPSIIEATTPPSPSGRMPGDLDLHDANPNRKSTWKKAVQGIAVLGLVSLSSFFVFQIVQKKGDWNQIFSPLHPYLVQLSEKFPALENWISPLPHLDDISPDEYEELKAALRSPTGVTPRFAMALSKANPLAPHFYITSRLPDGARFKISIIGIPETLLNQTHYAVHLNAVLQGKWAKTTPMPTGEGKPPLPRGEYLVYVTPLENQPDGVKNLIDSWYRPVPLPPEIQPETPLGSLLASLPTPLKDEKVLLYQTYFLGGTKDTTYLTRLKAFHDKLRERTSEELKELAQFANTLQNQFNSTTSQFALFRKGKPNPKQKKDWEQFNVTWSGLEGQLQAIFEKWTPEIVQSEYFYDTLYPLIQQTSQSVTKVHEFHSSYFKGVSDLRTFEIQLGEASSSCQNDINRLRSKIDQANKIAPTANGMPRKEGL